ncbi:MAG: DNA-binding domain-containing protein [Gallionella sp.]
MNAWSDELSRFALGIVRGHEIPSDMLAFNPKHPASTAIDVYRNNYRWNLHDALAGAYPVIEQLVGREYFRHLTGRFIGKHPSRSGNLHLYGAGMAEFVAAFETAQGLPYLPDVATLEWACHCAYFADDGRELDIIKLAQTPQERHAGLVLQTHPSCHLVRSRYPITSIWHAHQPGAGGDFKIDLDSATSNALVVRHDDIVQVSELSHADAEWLQHVQAGVPLGHATAATLDRRPEFDLQAALMNLVEKGVLAGFKPGELP